MIVYHELSSLCLDLDLSPSLLYGLSNVVGKHYQKTRVPKKDGSFRTLLVPDEKLKFVQQRIHERLLLPMPVSRYACAYYPGRGVIRNAQLHVGQPVLLKLDIWHFFDSILYRDVKTAAFPAAIYSEPLRVLLAVLCYGVNELPQGACTSPAISNLVLYTFDEEVGAFCEVRDINYSRYCDDMSFSGDFEPKEVIHFVSERLRERGFYLNRKKTVIARSSQAQRVTGLSVNEQLNVPPSYRRKIRQEMYYIEKYGVLDHLLRLQKEKNARDGHTDPGMRVKMPGQEETVSCLLSLLGRVNYCLQLQPGNGEFLSYKKKLTELLRETEKAEKEELIKEKMKEKRTDPVYGEVVSVQEMRERDQATIAAGTPGKELMARAARGIYEAYGSWQDGTVILTGSGNNGGDGFALAVILAEEGFSCTVLTLSDRRTPDSAYYEGLCRALDIDILPFTDKERISAEAMRRMKKAPVLVDCLLGTGFTGGVREPYAEAIRWINRMQRESAFVISADINSGMNGDSGEGELIVQSDLTVTIGLMKQGLLTENARAYIGELKVAGIGII